MRFKFDERKAAQAAALLLKLNGGEMKYMKLIKLLYLADREALLTTGRPITGDRFVAMQKGPVLSRLYDLINEEPKSSESPWYDYVSEPQIYSVRLQKAEPDLDELSRFEMGLLARLFEKYKNMDQFDLADLTHVICPEWRDPEGSLLPITPEDILRAEGKSQEEIERIEKECLDLQLIDNIQGLVG